MEWLYLLGFLLVAIFAGAFYSHIGLILGIATIVSIIFSLFQKDPTSVLGGLIGAGLPAIFGISWLGNWIHTTYLGKAVPYEETESDRLEAYRLSIVENYHRQRSQSNTGNRDFDNGFEVGYWGNDLPNFENWDEARAENFRLGYRTGLLKKSQDVNG
jgi:hypothetical protein